MQSFDFQVVIRAPIEKVFSVYTDNDRWQNRNIFGEIRWVQGEPWTAGSRMRIEVVRPIRAVVDQVLTQFESNRRVAYISHVYGITCQTQVSFVPGPAGTAVNVSMQLVGVLSKALGFAVEPAIEKSTRNFFDELRRVCEATVGQAAGGSGKG
jgi:hypothetical protein